MLILLSTKGGPTLKCSSTLIPLKLKLTKTKYIIPPYHVHHDKFLRDTYTLFLLITKSLESELCSLTNWTFTILMLKISLSHRRFAAGLFSNVDKKTVGSKKQKPALIQESDCMQAKLASKPFFLMSNEETKWLVYMNYAKRISHPYKTPTTSKLAPNSYSSARRNKRA